MANICTNKAQILHFTSLKVALGKGRECRALRVLIKVLLFPCEQRIVLFSLSDKVFHCPCMSVCKKREKTFPLHVPQETI